MIAFILRRLAQSIAVMLTVALIAFALFRVWQKGTPGKASQLNDILTLTVVHGDFQCKMGGVNEFWFSACRPFGKLRSGSESRRYQYAYLVLASGRESWKTAKLPLCLRKYRTS